MTADLTEPERLALGERVLAFGECALQLNDHQSLVELLMLNIKPFGFKALASGRLTSIGDRQFPTFYLLNWPDDFVMTYVSGGYINHDPIVARGVRSVDPFLWSEGLAEAAATGLHPKATELFECAADAGWHEGLAIPLHRRHGHELISLAGEAIDLRAPVRAAVTLMAHVAHERAVALTQSAAQANGAGAKPDDFSHTEIDCLKWMCASADDAEIARRLSLSDSEIAEIFASLLVRMKVKSRDELLIAVVYSGVLLF